MAMRSRRDVPFLSFSEAAARKRVSRVTIHKYARHGAFTLERMAGRRVIVNDARFRAWTPRPVGRLPGERRGRPRPAPKRSAAKKD